MLRTFAAPIFAPALGILTVLIPFIITDPSTGLQSIMSNILASLALYSIHIYPVVFAVAIPIWFLLKRTSLNKWKLLPLIGAGLIGIESVYFNYLYNYFSPSPFDWRFIAVGVSMGAAVGLYSAWILPPNPSTRA